MEKDQTLNLLIQAVNIAQARGVYTPKETEFIAQVLASATKTPQLAFVEFVSSEPEETQQLVSETPEPEVEPTPEPEVEPTPEPEVEPTPEPEVEPKKSRWFSRGSVFPTSMGIK